MAAVSRWLASVLSALPETRLHRRCRGIQVRATSCVSTTSIAGCAHACSVARCALGCPRALRPHPPRQLRARCVEGHACNSGTPTIRARRVCVSAELPVSPLATKPPRCHRGQGQAGQDPNCVANAADGQLREHVGTTRCLDPRRDRARHDGDEPSHGGYDGSPCEHAGHHATGGASCSGPYPGLDEPANDDARRCRAHHAAQAKQLVVVQPKPQSATPPP